MKTINDIVAEMLEFADADSQTIGRDVLRRRIQHFADRIKKAITNCNQQKDWRKICSACQEGEPPKDCEYFGEPGGCNAPTMGKHPTCKESLQVGNAAKMREALINVQTLIKVLSQCHADDLPTAVKSILGDIAFRVSEALSVPPRNCDIGSAAEQEDRFYKFCASNSSNIGGRCSPNCPCFIDKSRCHCACKWAQMPYVEGELK